MNFLPIGVSDYCLTSIQLSYISFEFQFNHYYTTLCFKETKQNTAAFFRLLNNVFKKSGMLQLVELLELVGHKESPLLELEQPPKIPRLVEDKQVFESTEGIPGVEEGVVKLVGLSK
jgi:hypothetical protein